MTYKASLDKTAIIITIAITVLFALVIGIQFSAIKDEGRTAPMVISTLCLLIYFLSYAFRPLGYTITKDELIIRRPLKNVHIKREEIQSVELIEKKFIKGSIRTFGAGGMFGYFGSFINSSLGRMTWYATRRDKPVLVRTVYKKNIILSPNETDSFVSALRS